MFANYIQPPNYENIIKNLYAEMPQIKEGVLRPRFTTFLQMWGSSALGFDIAKDGGRVLSGQVMTEAYTTVAQLSEDVYAVCFEEKPCYLVEKPTERFFEDLRNHRMLSKSNAIKLY